MIAGFTGTRQVPTAAQARALHDWMQKRGVTELHHGDWRPAPTDAQTQLAKFETKVRSNHGNTK